MNAAELRYRTLASAVAVVCAGLVGIPAHAQQEQLEEVVVTGSSIRRQADFAQPVQIIDNTEIQLQQSNSLAEMFKVMPQVVGGIATINTQEGGGNSPTSTINLRGLGNRSTLVLLNGRRQTIDGSGTGVDVNNMAPSIMIERIEMLLDGASAIYGSDAVAGVVNYITRDNFEGSEVRLDMQQIEASEEGGDFSFGFITGSQSDDSGVVAGIEFKKTSLILAEDLWDRERLANTLISSFANPGSFVPGEVGSPVAGRFPDPLCEDPRLAGPSGLRAGVINGDACGQVNSLGRTMQPDSEQWNGLALMRHDFGNGITANGELGFAQTDFEIPFGFVTPLLTPLPVVPADNPGVIAQHEMDPSFVVQPYRWWGRFLSPANQRIGALHRTGQNTYRVSLAMTGPIGEDWEWSAATWMSRSRTFFINKDVVSERFLNAINGYGGQDCPYRPETDPTGEFKGATEIGCFWFNPFANSALASPGDPNYNDPAMLDFVVGNRRNDGDAELRAAEIKFVGELWEMAGGATGIAIGLQRREQDFSQRWDELVRQGFDPVTGTGYRFNQPAIPDFSGTRNADSLFAELVMYPAESLEVQLAARREKFDRASSTDPKIGFIWNATDSFALRGTYGTSFRMPTEIQLFGRSPGGASTIPIGGEGINARGLTEGNENLEPETSENWTVGLTWDVNDNLSLSLDYWDVYFENLVTAESAQGLIETDMADGFLDNPQIVLFDDAPNPAEVCEVTGRWDPNSGEPAPDDCVTGVDIATVITSFINQDFRETAGVDFTLNYDFFGLGSDWNLRLTGVYTDKYEISTDGLVAEENVGGNTFAELRSNLALTWRRGDHFARATLRYISELGEGANSAPNEINEREPFTTLDIVGGTTLGPVNLSASVINVFGEEDPNRFGTLLPVASNIYDWRQRVLRVGFDVAF
ncbi:MAG TPA: TonB-dependent receptor [Gammaproteobacteria bacterium]